MTQQLTLALAGALSAAALGAGPAVAANGLACAKTASVTSGTVHDLSATGRVDASGQRRLNRTAVHHLRRGTYYATTGPAALRFGGFAYTVAAGSIFDLGCSGPAGGPADLPSLNVEMGSASVRTGGASSFGTLAANEMLVDPYANKEMGITLTRTPKGDPTLQDVVNWGPAALRVGRAVAEQTRATGAYLNITPYIGSKRRTNGQCHQAHGATITSTAVKGGYLSGKVRYSGLAPFSPR
jgi:hypothetical protein